MRSVVVSLVIIFLFSGCQKILEYYNHGESSIPPSCKIKGYKYDYFGSLYTTTIDYSTTGNPVLITYYNEAYPDGQASERLVFDNLNRLIFHEPYVYMGSTRVYVYEGNSRRPVRDTATDLWGIKYLETFKYDTKGRIIEEEIKVIYTPPDFEFPIFQTEVHRFYYDGRGNRQINPFDNPWHKTITYSDKKSIYSLHPAWQLIYRDYSINTVPNVSAVQQGYPIAYFQKEDIVWQPFLDLNYLGEVIYDCDSQPGK
jgi:hypothetical protein